MKLLLDEDAQSKLLVRLLRAVGHDVLTSNEAGLTSCSDETIFHRALSEERIVLTRNVNDFKRLHLANSLHAGILAIYQDADETNHMGSADIVRAIMNLSVSNWSLSGEFVSLNHWRFDQPD